MLTANSHCWQYVEKQNSYDTEYFHMWAAGCLHTLLFVLRQWLRADQTLRHLEETCPTLIHGQTPT